MMSNIFGDPALFQGNGRYHKIMNDSIESNDECMRCGKCCLANMAAFVSQIENGDFARWNAEGRSDILYILESESPVWVGDHLISSRTGRPIHGCPFLTWDKEHYSCEIYETRPLVCRAFTPGSSELCPRCKK